MREARPEDYPIYDKLYENLADLRTELRESGFELTMAQPVQRRYRAQYRAQVLLGPRSSLLCRAVIRGLERLPGGSPLDWIVTCRRA